jgi:hypothetical protein
MAEIVLQASQAVDFFIQERTAKNFLSIGRWPLYDIFSAFCFLLPKQTEFIVTGSCLSLLRT